MSPGPWLVLTPRPARSTGGQERPLHPALRPKSHKNPEQAVPAGPTANGTGSGASMYPAAPQASRPDLPSNCPESRINIPGLPACQPADLPLRRPSGQRSRVYSRPFFSWCLRVLTREVGPLSPESQTRCPVDLTPDCCPALSCLTLPRSGIHEVPLPAPWRKLGAEFLPAAHKPVLWSSQDSDSRKAGTPARVSGYKETCPEPTMDSGRYSGLGPPSPPVLVALYPRPYLASWWARSVLRSRG